MIYALLLIASLAHSQEVSTTSVTDNSGLSLSDSVTLSNLGKDTRALLQGRYTQTGKPTYANGFCFKNGTCQTTAPVSVSTAGPSAISFTPNLTASGSMTTTQGTVNNANYRIDWTAKWMEVDWYVYSITLGGTASTDLMIDIPAGRTAANLYSAKCAFIKDNAANTEGYAYTGAAGATKITVNRTNQANWTLSADARMMCHIAFAFQ